MVARTAVAVALALAAACAVAEPAAALEPGVFLDPGSPAGKEYSMPLSALRAAGAGRPAVEGRPQPLFGIGIAPAGTHGMSRGSGAGRAGRGATDRGTRAGGAVQTREPALAGISPGHGSSAPAVALLGALVVLGGLALGALLVATRRRLD